MRNIEGRKQLFKKIKKCNENLWAAGGDAVGMPKSKIFSRQVMENQQPLDRRANSVEK
jgi:hypothetical protein